MIFALDAVAIISVCSISTQILALSCEKLQPLMTSEFQLSLEDPRAGADRERTDAIHNSHLDPRQTDRWRRERQDGVARAALHLLPG